jgi:hypothetical protein
MERVLIPRLVREHGPNHRLVREAQRQARKLREAELAELARGMAAMDDAWRRELAAAREREDTTG